MQMSVVLPTLAGDKRQPERNDGILKEVFQFKNGERTFFMTLTATESVRHHQDRQRFVVFGCRVATVRYDLLTRWCRVTARM
jgi:hypothetical protein